MLSTALIRVLGWPSPLERESKQAVIPVGYSHHSADFYYRGGLAVLRAPLDGDWSLEQTLTQNGHTDIVRGTWLDLATGFVASCSEDGHVCLWSKQASVSHETEVSQNPAPLKVSHLVPCAMAKLAALLWQILVNRTFAGFAR